MKRLSLPYYVSRSGAGFESPENFLKSSTVVDTNTDALETVGIPIAQIDRDTYATTKEELHCFVIGETGCGKTRRVILPSIRLMAKTGESMVISDPKGELYRYTADSLRKRGYDVKVLNFRNPRCGNRWNPLAQIEALYKSGSLEDKDKAVMMIDDLISILSSGVEDKNDLFWSIAASNFFRGIAQVILEFGKAGDLTFENVAQVGRNIYQAHATRGVVQNDTLRAIKSFLADLPKTSPIIQNLGGIINNAEDTRNGINAVFEGMISMYCTQELLMDLFSKSEIDIAAIGKKPTALFFILPDDSDAMYPIATYFVKQVYSSLVSLADDQLDGRLPNRVTFLLDEFANFAKLPTMHAMLTAARSRRIRFVLVCQSMDQLIQKYEKDGMEILLSNCRVWLYMSCRNLPFLQRLVDLAGQYISPHTGEQCPLISVDTLQHFTMGQVLVLNDRCRPLIGYLDDYSQYDFGAEGMGELTELPDVHPTITRPLFSWDNAFSAAKGSEPSEPEPERKNPFITNEKSEAETQSPFENSGEINIDEMMARIDAKIHELERIEEAQKYIEHIKATPGDPIAKNNLAYLIRHHKMDVTDLDAPFDLSIPCLLKQGVIEHEPFSLMNMALYQMEIGRNDEAVTTLKEIKHEDYPRLRDFWFDTLWEEERDAEGALVSYICFMNNAFANHENTRARRGDMVRLWFGKIRSHARFDAFMKNSRSSVWFTELNKKYHPESDD